MEIQCNKGMDKLDNQELHYQYGSAAAIAAFMIATALYVASLRHLLAKIAKERAYHAGVILALRNAAWTSLHAALSSGQSCYMTRLC